MNGANQVRLAPRALLISTNGTGLGHLTRSMAIARRLEPELQPILLTTSSAVAVAREQGFFCEHFPSAEAFSPGGPVQWEDRLGRRLRELIDQYEPAAIVFDGVNPYWGLLAALRRAGGAARVWCRRPMWQPGVGAARLPLAAAFDAVIEPGELAAEDDRGPTVKRREQAIGVAPILFLDETEIEPRQRAAEEVGLDPRRPAALLQLGAGGAEIELTIKRCLERLRQTPGLQVAVVESAISGSLSLPPEVTVLRSAYPMSRLYAAFDLAVSAAGYNAFHELFRAGVPTLWLPQTRQLDDQAARARWAARTGAGVCCEDPAGEDLDRALAELLDTNRGVEMRARLREIEIGDGAAEAAEAIVELAR
ncbi:MAG: UDP-N-acetylglucosamine--N-acetylmuramyl-(pentapeptide) pyrophosphoryl-undecaprenol [Solirubrobacterales bacterium]|jgi:UDP:flavonoid glycosyltransferase YjiC (YdhE family)|nr:UDP-N-acetylglucosamine--N-acetylmuramyl-(pentapeptide) pyrophosphoryl-undecaprenol [Solirubrobacterales bacterium]MDX6662304.1 UDP-N-acetylglucosamine--N-acetylmuramyl-(pentapeptide) pyrophosphoryl-undecaprenol [Solirubrobacterales bacterium]